MRVAFLTDVHGNLPALDAVIADARACGVETFWDGGDVIGYYPWASECVHRLAAVCSLTVQGNYDRKVLKTPRRRKRWLRRKDPLKAGALIWAWEHLDERARELLAERPASARLKATCGKILVCHASPLSRTEPLGPATAAARWRELVVAAGGAALVLYGHVHIPHLRREGETLFVTPGPVGRSEDGDPRAAYALVDLSGSRPEVELRRVAYDTGTVAEAIDSHGLPDIFGEMVLRGISLPRARRRLQDRGR